MSSVGNPSHACYAGSELPLGSSAGASSAASCNNAFKDHYGVLFLLICTVHVLPDSGVTCSIGTGTPCRFFIPAQPIFRNQ